MWILLLGLLLSILAGFVLVWQGTGNSPVPDRVGRTGDTRTSRTPSWFIRTAKRLRLNGGQCGQVELRTGSGVEIMTYRFTSGTGKTPIRGLRVMSISQHDSSVKRTVSPPPTSNE